MTNSKLPDKVTLMTYSREKVLATALGAWAGVCAGQPVPENFGEVLIECANILGIKGGASVDAFMRLSRTPEFAPKTQ